ncbi:hypothetical protein PISMIDRAFT_680811, partial [Pisolithus microcarpus 441]
FATEIPLSLGPDPALGHASANDLPHVRRSRTLQDTRWCLSTSREASVFLVRQRLSNLNALADANNHIKPTWVVILSCTARTTPWCIFMAYTLKKNKERAMRAETGRTLNFLGTESHERDADHHWGMGAYR